MKVRKAIGFVILALLIALLSVFEMGLALLIFTFFNVSLIIGYACHLCVEGIGPAFTRCFLQLTPTARRHTVTGRAQRPVSPVTPVGDQYTDRHAGNFNKELCPLLRTYEGCSKNSRHDNFIGVDNFAMMDLPVYCQDTNIFTYIKTLVDITVRVNISFTSKNRPESDPYYKNRCTNCVRTGSGWIANSTAEVWNESNKHTNSTPCPCEECHISNNPKKKWGLVEIWTASHLVFDDSEAKQTKVDLIIDGKNVQLFGLKMNYMCPEGDRCSMYCVTHSLEEWDKLKELSQLRFDAGNKIQYSKYCDAKLSVHVSFPHGVEKAISLGQWINRCVVKYERDITANKHKDKVRTEYTYDNMTCPGCSGGLIWFLGKVSLPSTVHPHSSTTSSTSSEVGHSGVGWE